MFRQTDLINRSKTNIAVAAVKRPRVLEPLQENTSLQEIDTSIYTQQVGGRGSFKYATKATLTFSKCRKMNFK